MKALCSFRLLARALALRGRLLCLAVLFVADAFRDLLDPLFFAEADDLWVEVLLAVL